MIPKNYKEIILRLYELPNLISAPNKTSIKEIKKDWKIIQMLANIPLKET